MDRMTIVNKDGENLYVTEGEKVVDLTEDPLIKALRDFFSPCPVCGSPDNVCICEEASASQEKE
jgi:hypothetical protein